MLAVLMLRGDQTPGELKQRTERMQPFDSIDELQEVLTRLIDRGLVAQLARRPGQKEERFRHRLSEDADDDEQPGARAPRRPRSSSRRRRGATSGWTSSSARWPSCARSSPRCAPSSARERLRDPARAPRARGWSRWAAEHGAMRTETRPGRVTFTGADGATLVAEPPFPPLATHPPVEAFAPQPLVDHAARNRVVGVLLVRLGGYAAGVFNGTRLVDLQGRRAQRARPQQRGRAEPEALRAPPRRASRGVAHDAAAEAGAGVLLPHFDDLDAVILGGDRFALAAVLEDPRLRKLAHLTTERVLDVPDPRLAVLRATPDRFRATMLHTLDPRPAPPDAAPGRVARCSSSPWHRGSGSASSSRWSCSLVAALARRA